MFIFVALLIFLMMHTVVIFWFCQNTPVLTLNTLAKLLPLLLTAGYITLYALSKKINFWPLENILLIYLGALFLAFCIVFGIVIITLILKFFHITLPNSIGFWAFGIWMIVMMIGLYTAAKSPKITDITFEAPNLKQDTKIAFVSDTHFGATVSLKRAKNLKQIIENNKPDLIVFTGDIFETNFKDSIPFAEVFEDILPGKKFGVFGNHEYYQGLNNARQSFKKAGINLLENRSENLEDINIIGINDIRTANISKQEFENILKREIKQNKFNLLLTHTPLYFEEAASNGVNLMLSGHNHNGQIWPFNFLVRITNPYLYGHFKSGQANLFVTSGTFFWGPPIRFLTNNEIIFITLKGDK
ncbi:MAG: metallophosphoesterase [Elusimicrobiaceae bacterium]|nr:metallophosphoesterase [Elusimicrobiaceae bacterium]